MRVSANLQPMQAGLPRITIFLNKYLYLNKFFEHAKIKIINKIVEHAQYFIIIAYNIVSIILT